MAIYMTIGAPDEFGYCIPSGYYHSQLCQDILSGAIEITREQFEELTNNRQTRRWLDGQVSEYAAPVDCSAAISERQSEMNRDLHAYIYGVYDQGTQASMQALFSKANTPAAIKTDIESVWAWIASIMTYYYQCKSEIAALTDADAVAAYTWDFSRFDATLPAVTLQGIFAAI
jgi:hypothetical protein